MGIGLCRDRHGRWRLHGRIAEPRAACKPRTHPARGHGHFLYLRHHSQIMVGPARQGHFAAAIRAAPDGVHRHVRRLAAVLRQRIPRAGGGADAWHRLGRCAGGGLAHDLHGGKARQALSR